MMVNEGLEPDKPKNNYIWQSPTENGRQNGYTPCPPELMKQQKKKLMKVLSGICNKRRFEINNIEMNKNVSDRN